MQPSLVASGFKQTQRVFFLHNEKLSCVVLQLGDKNCTVKVEVAAVSGLCKIAGEENESVRKVIFL